MIEMTGTKKSIFFALVALCIGAGALLLPTDADAAVGIVRWSAVGTDPTATITYRLNVAANSGTVQIVNVATSAVVRTITLAAADLTDGTHSIFWDGTTDSGASAPTATYKARISVSKNAVALPGVQRRIRDHSVQAPTNHRYFGIDADNNPANNNQTNPALSTFGNVYVSNTVSKNIEVWMPGNAAGADYAECVFGDPETLPGWTTSITASSWPWGLAVSRSGRVFSSDRTNSRLANFAWDGSNPKISGFQGSGNTRDTDVLGTDPTTDGVFHAAISTSNKAGAIKLANDYLAPAPSTNYKTLVNGAWTADSSTAQGIGFEDETKYPWNTKWYFASDIDNKVFRYSGTGTNWDDTAISLDASFNGGGSLTVTGCTDVAVNQYNPNIIAVSKKASPNIEVWNVGGAAAVKVTDITIGTSGASKIAFDAWGNLLITQGNYLAGVWAMMYEVGDSGSSDTRETDAATFTHTFGNNLPVVESAVVSSPGDSSSSRLPVDDTTTTTITVVVRDSDGAANLTGATIDLTPFGYGSAVAPTTTTTLDATHVQYVFTGIKAKPTTHVGADALVITATDHVGSGTGTATVWTSGGTITGIIRHKAGSFPIANATVTLTDSGSGNVYTAQTAADGTYNALVNPGTFKATAAKTNYGPGNPSSDTTVALGATASPTSDATLGSISINQARSAPIGSIVCVEAVVAGAGYTPVIVTVNGNLPKFYLRDSSGSNNNGLVTKTNNLGLRCYILDANPAPADGDRFVVEGTTTSPAYQEYRLESVTGYARISQGQLYPEPDAGVVDDIDDIVNANIDVRWGDLIKLTQVQYTTDPVVDTTNWYELKVTDGAKTATVVVWKQIGVTLAELQALAGTTRDLTGIISRNQKDAFLERENVLEPRSRDDIFGGAPQDVASVGEAKSKKDGTIINFTASQVVTLGDVGFFYMESSDGSAGIRVDSGDTVAIGDKVTVTGATIGTNASGERVLTNGTVANAGPGGTVPIWTMINRSMGGKSYVDQGGGVVAYGLDNQGLLVKIFGLVTYSDFVNNYFLIDDGSNVSSQDAAPGVRVINTPYVLVAPQYARITGVVSSEIVNGKNIRVLRARQDFNEVEILAP